MTSLLIRVEPRETSGEELADWDIEMLRDAIDPDGIYFVSAEPIEDDAHEPVPLTWVIEMDDDVRDGVPLDHPDRHKSFIKRTANGRIFAYSKNMTPMALSNYSPNAAALSHALEAATTREEALDAVRNLTYARHGQNARLL